jgi:predicted membrane metal-binding protein
MSLTTPDPNTSSEVLKWGLVTFVTVAAFVISIRHKSIPGSVLLLANGIVMTIYGVIVTNGLSLLYFPGPIIPFIVGLGLLGIAFAKSTLTGEQLSEQKQQQKKRNQ